MLRERNGRTNLDRLGYMHGADSVRCQREKNETICGVNEKSVMAAFLSVMFFFGVSLEVMISLNSIAVMICNAVEGLHF